MDLAEVLSPNETLVEVDQPISRHEARREEALRASNRSKGVAVVGDQDRPLPDGGLDLPENEEGLLGRALGSEHIAVGEDVETGVIHYVIHRPLAEVEAILEDNDVPCLDVRTIVVVPSSWSEEAS